MLETISHNRSDESPESKARWFQSLSLAERMDMLCFFTDLILDNNPKIVEKKNAQPTLSRGWIEARDPTYGAKRLVK